MDQEIKDKWIAALRSGDYKQGKNKLNNNDKLCCLGVLCEITGIPKRPCVYSPSTMVYVFNEQTELDGITPYWFCDIPIEVRNHLVHMNDTWGNSFNQIADYIEENL